jgi:hypothetical protein
MHDIIDVIQNIQTLYENNSSLAALKDVERVFDEMDMYVYKNWIDGELAYGPKVERHWITAGFMWPRDKMPDPMAAKRLTEIGCKISYQKTHLMEARQIRKPDDIRPGTKKGKMDRKPIWVVEVTMPKKLVFDIYKGYMNKMREELGDDGVKSQPPTPLDTNAAAQLNPMSAPPPIPGAQATPGAPGAPAPGGMGAPSPLSAPA